MRASSIAIGVIFLAAFGAALSRWVRTEVAEDDTTSGIVPSETEPRSYRMGFSILPPDPTDSESFARNFNIWAQRADAGLLHIEVPWKNLLEGDDAETVAKRDLEEAFRTYHENGLAPVLTIDPLNGLDRSSEARELKAEGRSIVEPEIQALYREYVLAATRIARPDYLGLAAEVDLFHRQNDRPEVYSALVEMIDAVAEELERIRPGTKLFVSLSVEEAWRRPAPEAHVRKMLEDYPFVEVVALSSYPAFHWDSPSEIPEDCFKRLKQGRDLPIILVEGGWPSRSARSLLPPAWIESSPERQAAYIRRLELLLDRADAELATLLFFADVDPKTFPFPNKEKDTLDLFASMGLVTSSFEAKPALKVWDRIQRRPLKKASVDRVQRID